MFKRLLDSLTTSERVLGACILVITVIFAKLSLFFIQGLKNSFKPALPAALVVVQGIPCARKESVMAAITGRFEHCSRPFLRVSLRESLGFLTSAQSRRFFSRLPDGSLQYSQQGASFLNGLHDSWKALSDAGNNLIIDHSLTDIRQWDNFRKTLGSTLLSSLVLVQVDGSAPSSDLLLQGEAIDRFPELFSGQIAHVRDDKEVRDVADTVAQRLAAMRLL
jgi:hypothetical protein